jgi:hypothetical protein
MQAICMPRQMPKNGTPRSRAKRTAGDLAFAAALAEPARHQNAVHRLQLRGDAGVLLLEISASIQRMLTLTRLAMPPWTSASFSDL